MDTATKKPPIYRYRVVAKDGQATVERRAMKWKVSSFYSSNPPSLTPIRDFSSYDNPEAETAQGAIDAARATLQRQMEHMEAQARECMEKAEAVRMKLMPIEVLAARLRASVAAK